MLMEINYFEWRVPRAVPGGVSSQDKQILTWPYTSFLGFPGGSGGKESASNAGDLGSIPGLGRSPREGHGNPLQCSCLENPHGQRSLVGCSPWGHRESDRTE